MSYYERAAKHNSMLRARGKILASQPDVNSVVPQDSSPRCFAWLVP